MSFKLMAKAMNIKTGGPIPKLILLKLCDNANDAGICWPSNSAISDECEVHERTVIRNINNLIEKGFLTKESRVADNGRTTSNGYQINLEGRVAQSQGEGGTESGGRVAQSHPHYIEPTIINLPIEQNINKKILEEGKQLIKSCFTFDDFWEAYDYKKGKPKCIQYYDKLDEKERALIKKHVSRYVESTMKPSKPEKDKFIRKHPSTYLYQECWNDELDVEEPTGFKSYPYLKVFQRPSGAYALSGLSDQDMPLLPYPLMDNTRSHLYFWNGQQVLFDVEGDCYTLDAQTPIDPDGFEAGPEHCSPDVESSIKSFEKELSEWRNGGGAE